MSHLHGDLISTGKSSHLAEGLRLIQASNNQLFNLLNNVSELQV